MKAIMNLTKETLTPREKLSISRQIDEWNRGSRADGHRERAERGLGKICAHLGIETPRILWFTSPESFCHSYLSLGRLDEHMLWQHFEEIHQEGLESKIWEYLCLSAEVDGNGWGIDGPYRSYPEENLIEKFWTSRSNGCGPSLANQLAQTPSEDREYKLWQEIYEQVSDHPVSTAWNELFGQMENTFFERILEEVSSAVYAEESVWYEWPYRLYDEDEYEVLQDTLNIILEGSTDIHDIHDIYRHLIWYKFFQEEKSPPMEGLVELVENTFAFLLFEEVCFLIDRHQTFLYDDEGHLHGDGKPAISFPSGWKRYYWRGREFPEKYGQVPSHEWDPRWIIEETNVETRRTLMNAMGFERLFDDFKSESLDKWREYELFRIEETIDVEPVFLLSMIDSSTGERYLLRVPPHLDGARAAARWINHGIDPEEFEVET